jgi:hypothetical protein
MRTDLGVLRRMSVPNLVGYLVVVGALAGVFAWCLVLAGHFAFGIDRPTWLALLLAIPRGSFYALIVGFGLRLWWRVR